MKRKKVLVLSFILLFILLFFTSCESADDLGTTGLKIFFYPGLAWFDFLFSWFSPAFWHWIGLAFEVNIIVGLLSGLLGTALYLILMAIGILIGLILLLLATIVWFLVAILNGIFHFTEW